MPRPPRRSTLFPYTTLFRSNGTYIGEGTAGGAETAQCIRNAGNPNGPRLGLFSETYTRCILNSRSEEHTSELQSQSNLVCRLLLAKKKGHSAPPPRVTLWA